MLIIDDWLEDRIAERPLSLTATDDPQDFEMLAGVLRAEAEAAGYDVSQLLDACNGDVVAFLMARQIEMFEPPHSDVLTTEMTA